MKSLSIKAPSNIALIKYWGKKANQIPCNSSLSFNLKNCYTKMEFNYSYDKIFEDFDLKLDFNDENAPKDNSFADKIKNKINKSSELKKLFKGLKLLIRSENTFPHSTGIASSASSMAALVKGVCEINRLEKNEKYLEKDLSFYARLLSGSASRSFYKGYNIWGQCSLENSSNEYAVNLSEIHENFSEIQDSVLVISTAPKPVSSSQGHLRMSGHMYAEKRYEVANQRLESLIHILKNGDWSKFKSIVRSEALDLHAMMMTCPGPYFLMTPKTLAVINELMELMSDESKITFTLDAGPNIHLLYHVSEKIKVKNFINKLKNRNLIQRNINDQIG